MVLDEELLEIDDIQGNILAGFNKDHQVFLFLKMSPNAPDLVAIRAWLRHIAPQVNSVAEVAGFNSIFRIMHRRQRSEPKGLVATWLNIAFSAAALRSLTTSGEVDIFTDIFYKDGLAAHSNGLGDPIDPAAPGHPNNWVVGGPNNEADIVVIIASDSPVYLAERLANVRKMLPAQLTELWEQPGKTLDKPFTGHEHFGFKDGVSQPGVRGLTQTLPKQLLTPRLIDPAKTPQADPTLPEFAAPGQPLVWPGQFVFGYRRQSNSDARNPPAYPNDIANGCPSWGRNGSYLVVRRLNQNVAAFRVFMRATAADLATQPGFAGMTTTRFASMCVGRWPSGAPIMRSTTADNVLLGDDGHANNFFQFAKDSPPAPPLLPDTGYAGDYAAISKRDDKGITCPFSGHVRKVNPRDTNTEQGNSVDVLTRLVLRRGIPFGPVYPGGLEQDAATTLTDKQAQRGLVFVSYQTSIEEQFVFLQTTWANHLSNPNGAGGQDPIIGQGDRMGDGFRSFSVRAAGQPPQKLNLPPNDWVVPTGGGFFFSPSISAIATVLAKDP